MTCKYRRGWDKATARDVEAFKDWRLTDVRNPQRVSPGAFDVDRAELATESGLPRWKLYKHRDLIEDFQAKASAQNAVPDALRQMKADNERLTAELANATAALAAERARTALLRRTLAEASIELEHARQHRTGDASVTRLPTTRRTTRTQPDRRP